MTTLQPTPGQPSSSGGWQSAARRLMAHCDGPILAAILVGAVVRAYAFGDVPPGMHQDEASAGYDAYALLYYGIDRNGFHNPAGLIAWGSGMFALVSYVAMPFIALLGLTPIAVRLPFLILGVASILMLAWLVKEIHGPSAARIAALLLAIAPGPILMSRWALDANLMPPILLAGVLTAVLSLRHAWLLPLSFALFGLSLYAYGTAYIAVPVMLAMIMPYALAHRRMTIGPLAVALLVGGLVAVPALLYALVNFFKWDSIVTPFFSAPRMPGPGRYETVGNFDLASGRFFKAAFQNVCGAMRLFVVQSEQRPWNSLPGFGEIYLVSLPFTLVGLVMLCRTSLRRPFSPAWYMFAWCVASAVVTLFVDPSLNHLSVGILPMVYCTALGLSAVYERWRVPSYGMFAVYAISFVAFCAVYFPTCAAQLTIAFRGSLLPAIHAASEDPNAVVCITEGAGFPYIYALFASREDPHEFIRTVHYTTPGEEWQQVASFGRYRFGIPMAFQPEIDVYIVYPGELELPEPYFSTERLGAFVLLRKRK